MPHITPITVYYEDIDNLGIVYHANYLRFFDRARLQWLASLGYDLQTIQENGLLFAIKNIEIDYCKPAKLGNNLMVLTTLIQLKRVSFTCEQKLYCVNTPENLLCRMSVQVVNINHEFKPVPWPGKLVEEIRNSG